MLPQPLPHAFRQNIKDNAQIVPVLHIPGHGGAVADGFYQGGRIGGGDGGGIQPQGVGLQIGPHLAQLGADKGRVRRRQIADGVDIIAVQQPARLRSDIQQIGNGKGPNHLLPARGRDDGGGVRLV